MEVYAASRRDLANAIQSYNDNDSITFISAAKVRRKSEVTKEKRYKKELPPIQDDSHTSPTLPEAQSFSIFFLMLFPPLIPRFLIIPLETYQFLLIVFHVPHVRLNGFVFCPCILFRTFGLAASADGYQSK